MISHGNSCPTFFVFFQVNLGVDLKDAIHLELPEVNLPDGVVTAKRKSSWHRSTSRFRWGWIEFMGIFFMGIQPIKLRICMKLYEDVDKHEGYRRVEWRMRIFSGNVMIWVSLGSF